MDKEKKIFHNKLLLFLVSVLAGFIVYLVSKDFITKMFYVEEVAITKTGHILYFLLLNIPFPLLGAFFTWKFLKDF